MDTDAAASLRLSTLAVTDRAAAFNGLVERHLSESYRLASVLLRDRHEAEDATHDAVVRAWERWDQLRDRTRFRAWFQEILVNGCRDRLRRRSGSVREIAVDPALEFEAQPVGDLADRAWLEAALARLSPDHQIVIALRFYVDLPVDEIALRTKTNLGTVKSRLHYALRALRAAYEAQNR